MSHFEEGVKFPNMKRDWVLIHRILKYVEENGDGEDPISLRVLYDYHVKEIKYHLTLCVEAGFITLADPTREPHIENVLRLTWDGHNKLDELSMGDSPRF